jgi:hypothetical protein
MSLPRMLIQQPLRSVLCHFDRLSNPHPPQPAGTLDPALLHLPYLVKWHVNRSETEAKLAADAALVAPVDQPPSPDLSDSSEESSPRAHGEMITPVIAHAPLPMDTTSGHGDSHTPRAGLADLPNSSQAIQGKKDGERLATDLNQLQVRSPLPMEGELPPVTESAIDTISNQPTQPMTIPNQYQHQPRQESMNSNSTEDSSGHFYPPSSLSDYTPDGFLKSTMPTANEQAVDPLITAQAEAAVLQADEAVKRMNGTASVRDASSINQPGGPFVLPGGFANFANPNHRNLAQLPPSHPSRQASTSTTSASTSSEEEDLCVPSVDIIPGYEHQWIPRSRTHPGPASYLYTPYIPQVVTQQVPSPRAAAQNSPRVTGSPRQNDHNGHSNSHAHALDKSRLPLGATAHSPRGLPTPMGIVNNEDEDDDADTVGDRRSRSRSTSSECRPSATSGKTPADTKGKRKAGSEAVAGRGKTVPSSSTAGKKPAGRRTSAKEVKLDTNVPPRKRRRSEVSDSQIDPMLQDDSSAKMEVEDEYEGSDAADDVNSGDSEYGGEARPKSKPRGGRKSGGKAKPVTASRGTTKKAKAARPPVKSSGIHGQFRCDYVNPLPVSCLVYPQTCADHLAIWSMPGNVYAYLRSTAA